MPATVIRQAAPLPEHERVGQFGRLLTGYDLPPRTRVAAAKFWSERVLRALQSQSCLI
jgi:hypothetical protein